MTCTTRNSIDYTTTDAACCSTADASSSTRDRHVIAADRSGTGHELGNSNDDTGSDTDGDTDDITSVDNISLWLCHKPPDDLTTVATISYCDPDGSASNPTNI